MKKEYIAPAVEIAEVEVSQMMAQSLVISETEVDGADAHVKDDQWNIWE